MEEGDISTVVKPEASMPTQPEPPKATQREDQSTQPTVGYSKDNPPLPGSSPEVVTSHQAAVKAEIETNAQTSEAIYQSALDLIEGIPGAKVEKFITANGSTGVSTHVPDEAVPELKERLGEEGYQNFLKGIPVKRLSRP